MNKKLLDEEVRMIKHRIIFRKPYGETINLMANSFGLGREEAQKEYEKLVLQVHEEQSTIKYKGT